ncbi:MAG: PAS domain-containing protein, partial [Bacteroidota bacterium]
MLERLMRLACTVSGGTSAMLYAGTASAFQTVAAHGTPHSADAWRDHQVQEVWRGHLEGLLTNKVEDTAASSYTVWSLGLQVESDGGGHRVLWIEGTGPKAPDADQVEAVREVASLTTAWSLPSSPESLDNASEAQRLLEILVAAYPFGAIVVYDHDLRYQIAGGQGLQTVGLEASQLVGRTIAEVYDADTCSRIEPAYRQALAGETEIMEVQYNDRWFTFIAGPLPNAEGTIDGGFVITFDITDLRNAREALARSESRLRSIIESYPFGVIAMFDTDLRYQVAGGSLQVGAHDSSRQDLPGKTPQEVFARTVADQLTVDYTHAIRGNVVTRRVSHDERAYETHVGPVRNTEGSILGGLVVTHDVTEEDRATRELSILQARLQTIMDHATQAFVLIASDGTVLLANQRAKQHARLFYQQEVEPGISFMSLVSEVRSAHLQDAIQRALQGETYTEEVFAADLGLWYEYTLAPVLGGREVEAVVFCANDITEKQEAALSIKTNEQRLKLALEAGAQVLWDIDLPTGASLATDRWTDLLGYGP